MRIEGGEILIKDLKRYGRLAVAWDRHGSPVPRWTLTRYGLDNTPNLLALAFHGATPAPSEGSTVGFDSSNLFVSLSLSRARALSLPAFAQLSNILLSPPQSPAENFPSRTKRTLTRTHGAPSDSSF